MSDVRVIRPGTPVWDAAASLRPAAGESRSVVLPEGLARMLGLEPGTVVVAASARAAPSADDDVPVLLFDEAEPIFSRRSDVRDAHDRYANLE
ncbi:hypothetical protein [Microbacterium sp. P03]|uniref:hypothetical protein n=1 Tax=Microbacterium sp. P03 TaxID=3366946 RepID=UPI00374582EA